MEPLLTARDISCVQAKREIFRIDHFALMRGEVLAMVGPNGAGKTSLLLTLALVHPAATGTIVFDGETAHKGNLLQLRRRMAVVFQESLLFNMSVQENLAVALRIRGVSRKDALYRTEKWLKRFGIAHLARQSARSLSGGEAQRTSLARAFALEPDLLFLDEPFAALDYPTRNTLLNELGQLLKDMKMTTFFVTHDYSEIPYLAQRTAVLYDGRIVKCGTNSEIFGRENLERRAWVPWE